MHAALATALLPGGTASALSLSASAAPTSSGPSASGGADHGFQLALQAVQDAATPTAASLPAGGAPPGLRAAASLPASGAPPGPESAGTAVTQPPGTAAAPAEPEPAAAAFLGAPARPARTEQKTASGGTGKGPTKADPAINDEDGGQAAGATAQDAPASTPVNQASWPPTSQDAVPPAGNGNEPSPSPPPETPVAPTEDLTAPAVAASAATTAAPTAASIADGPGSAKRTGRSTTPSTAAAWQPVPTDVALQAIAAGHTSSGQISASDSGTTSATIPHAMGLGSSGVVPAGMVPAGAIAAGPSPASRNEIAKAAPQAGGTGQPSRPGETPAAPAKAETLSVAAVAKVDAQTLTILGDPAGTTDLTAGLALPAVAGSADPRATTPVHPASGSAVGNLASPAQQVAPALLSMTQSHDGTQHMTLRLNPAELGMVQVRIDRAATGPASVAITAERSDTLQMLRQDTMQLHRTLDQAGVPAEGRTISFHVEPAGQPASSGGNTSSNGNSGGSSGGSSGNTPGHTGGNANGSGSGGYAARDNGGYAGNRRPNLPASQAERQDETTTPTWLRVGLDITA
ncbi:flagellar hook-length control protein FliK [Rhodopila sp.]|uniref:flagellar hook-length control protein FliK n=1 Tax=Rhodopila sp. TaxID=2480087 RepID=UPI003D0E1EE1